LGAQALLVRAGALGDVLLLRRAVATLRRRYRGVLLIAPLSSGGVLVGPGAAQVDELVPWERAEIAALFAEDGRPEGQLRERLRDVRLAVVYSRNAALVRSLGRAVPCVVGHDPNPAAGVHASEWLTRPLEDLGLDAPAALEPMQATEAEAAQAGRLLRELPEHFVAIHAGSGSPSKNWPPDRFGLLLDAIAPSGRWLLVEGPADADASALLMRRAGALVARALDARILGAVLARAGLFVGHDSGVSHLAAAWGAPTLALFGPTDPALWAPRGQRVSVVRAPEGRMVGLGVDAVIAAAATLVARAGGVLSWVGTPPN
jgi:ADP-heptose:LPS heptosyltransferase